MTNMQYITTDLEFDSPQNLARIVDELGDNICPHLNEWIDDVYRVALGGAFSCGCPEHTVARFCTLLEALSDPSKALWEGCSRRVLDIAFESGTTPTSLTYELSAGLIKRVTNLGLSLAVTLYPVGAYSVVEEHKPIV